MVTILCRLPFANEILLLRVTRLHALIFPEFGHKDTCAARLHDRVHLKDHSATKEWNGRYSSSQASPSRFTLSF